MTLDLDKKSRKNSSAEGGVLYAGFLKLLTPKEFAIVLQKIHQVCGHPRHSRSRYHERTKQKQQENKNLTQLYSKLPLMQPCRCLNFVGCERLGNGAMLYLNLIPSTVVDLDFSSCNLTPIGVGRLCEFLRGSNSNIKRMILWGNRIGNEGAMFLAEMIKVNTTLEELCIRELDRKKRPGKNCLRITRSGWVALSKALAVNKTLRCLDFANSEFGNKDLITLGAGLRKNKGLETLDLGLSSITDYGIRCYLQRVILKHNKTLRHVKIPYCCYDKRDNISLNTTQEVTYALRRNHLFLREEDDTLDNPTDEDWFNLLVLTSAYADPTCSFWLLRKQKPDLCSLAYQ
mmetsp:Transcript_16826/g.18706  ORF Transcript_16826/g.18706 Transcript_16826/m.18706 type:complete len:345 (+) Transcript_16826:202-1236(+)